ncbi:unnamed protein product [Caenorhabditis auriculariae]|uniref:NOC3-like protein n=1 Tax=Caenorhabditis auriculariae TaxID=2777116 RepID=A0A8S1HGJ3_9PELO|nr:unnamed protein product [Caenorhabditis auriculariae]
MGLASAPREEKLKMMKTSKTRKTVRKLNSLGKKGKISRDVQNQLKNIKAKKSKESHQRIFNIEEDWKADREFHYHDEDESLPLDMLDDEYEWQTSVPTKKRAGRRNFDKDDEEVDVKKRRFKDTLQDDQEELLPIKLSDGRLIRPTKEKTVKEEEEDDYEQQIPQSLEELEEEKTTKFEDFTSLSAAELISKRKELLDEHKISIASHSNMILTNPHENVGRLRDLLKFCEGEGVHPLIRESIQKLSMASLLQVLVDIIPGYAIRQWTEEEKSQKQKKETRKLQAYEESLLRYYLKFLQLCEKLASKLCAKDRKVQEATFTYKIGFLSIKALERLAISAPHFNYATNITSTLVRLSLSKIPTVVNAVCAGLEKLFKEDLSLKGLMTLFAARSISTLVTKKKGNVPPLLISTFLTANIRETKNEDKKSGKDRLIARKYQLKKEKANKTARKYKKQLEKLEADLKEVEAEESISNKLKNATEAMKFIFQTYFSILKRMPNVALLEPVLEGLSKFAHLLNIEFFEDIVHTMGNLLSNKSLRLIDQLHCVHTVFVLLSGEGQILNVDPSKFYRIVYRLLNHIPFEKKFEQRLKVVTIATKTLDIMLSERRKMVPLSRVAAFVKRILAICTVIDEKSALCFTSHVRSLFIAHPKLLTLVEEDESAEEGSSGGLFHPELDDPDVSNAVGSEVRSELSVLIRSRDKNLAQVANNLLHGVPSTGLFKVPPQLTSLKPWEVIETSEDLNSSRVSDIDPHFNAVERFAKGKNQQLSPGNIHVLITNWLESR